MAALAAALVVALACAPPSKKAAPPFLTLPSPTPTPTAPLMASSPPFHTGEVGVAYASVALTATGGLAPYTWSVSVGELPGGLNLGSDGSVSGTPTAAGNFSFTIQVADSGDSKATVPGTIGVAPALSVSLIPACSQYCKVELGCVDVCGAFGAQSGGVAPYGYNLTQGPLPAGTSLNQLSLAGTFKGLAGYLKFTVQVSDAMGATATIAPTFWMYDHIAWNGTYLCFGSYVKSCQVQIKFSGGIPGGQPLVTLGTVGAYCPTGFTVCPPAPANAPSGMTATASPIGPNGGTGTVMVAMDCGGPPGGCPNGYYGAIGLVLVDVAPCGANARCQSGIATVDVYMMPG